MGQSGIEAVPKSRWFRILPAVVLIYIVASLDRVNIGFALNAGMDQDLGLTATFGGIAAGIFFIGYLFLQVPGAMLAEKKNAKNYIAWTVVAFSLASIVTGLCQTGWQLIIMRFVQGFTEGGLFPAILVLITHWFPDEERGRANGFFLMNSAIAGVVGGPLAAFVLPVGGWRGLFILEGIIGLVVLAILVPLIDDRPESSKKISAQEREYITQKLGEERAKYSAGLTGNSFRAAMRSVNSWKLVVIYFCMQVGIYGFTMWLPVTIRHITDTSVVDSSFLTAIPNVISMVGCFVLAAWSDRTGNRRFWTAAGLVGFAICVVLASLLVKQPWVAFAFLCGCGFFLHSPSGVFWTMPPLVAEPGTAAAQRGVVNAIGNVGGFVGPVLVGWVTDIANSSIAFYVLIAFALIGVAVTLTMPEVTRGSKRRAQAATS